MPMYDFRCPACGDFEALVAVSERDQAQHCPDCGQTVRRLVSMPRLAVISAAVRQAHETNERSVHEPRLRSRHSCCSGGRCSHQKTRPQARAALQQSKNRQARPWMLGH